jgi:hypothetical protein
MFVTFFAIGLIMVGVAALLVLGWGLEIAIVTISGKGRQQNPFADVAPEDEYPLCRTIREAWRAAIRDINHWRVYVGWRL